MSSTITETEPYVVCSDYCGLKITATGDEGVGQHAADCGAPQAERAKLDGELKVKKIRAAIPPEERDEELNTALPADDVPAAKFVCSCGAPFSDWPELGQHQTGLNHVGMWTEPSDALDDDALQERENSTTVDGAAARIDHSKPPKGVKIEKVDYSHLWRDPEITVEMVHMLQEKIDAAELTIGGIAAGKACAGKMTVHHEGSNVEVGCPHKCFARTVRKNECDLEHTHSETLEQHCLIHAITGWGAGKPVAGLGPLFPADA